MTNFRKEQKEDKKQVDKLMKDYKKEELARMLVHERKRKNKYLNDFKAIKAKYRV